MSSPDHERNTAPDGGSADHTPAHLDPSDQHAYDSERHLPSEHNPLPALDHVGDPDAPISSEAFSRVQATDEFAELRRRFRSFAFPMSAVFLIWYFVYVLLSVFARSFMATPLIGNLNIGMVMGLLQFVTTFLITWLYIRHMNRSIDPISTKLRAVLEGADR